MRHATTAFTMTTVTIPQGSGSLPDSHQVVDGVSPLWKLLTNLTRYLGKKVNQKQCAIPLHVSKIEFWLKMCDHLSHRQTCSPLRHENLRPICLGEIQQSAEARPNLLTKPTLRFEILFNEFSIDECSLLVH